MKLEVFVSAFVLASSLVAGCGGPDDPEAPACDVPGEACTWLGKPGVVAFTKDGGKRLDTAIYWSMDTLFASDGTVWFIDWNNHLVRRIMQDGTIKSMIGWNDPVFPGDGDVAAPMLEKTPDGDLGTNVQLNHPTDLLEMPDGQILVMAWHNHKLRSIDPATGMVRIIGGGGGGLTDGPLAAATFKQPSRLTIDENQNLYILDQGNLRIRKVDHATGMVSQIAGKGTMPAFGGDGGDGLQANFAWEVGSNPEPSGGIAYKSGALYIADTDNHRVRKLDLATNIVTTIAGTGTAGFSGDGGAAASAELNAPRDLEIGPDGDLYIADTDNGRVRAIDLNSGTIRTVIGTGELGFTREEEVDPTTMRLHRTFGVDFDAEGNLYVADTLNSRIVKVNHQ
jgi:DNA-binding beta-propeller fold protein YncE